jgi:5-formyltetrahydrofolate cyclo-ligase
MTLAEQKHELRKIAKQQRTEAVLHAGSEADVHFTEHLLSIADKIGIGSDTVIGGYWAMSNEFNVGAAMRALMEQYDLKCALPVVIAKDTPLVFRRWTHGMKLEPGGFGTEHPPESSPECVPDVLLIPLLAFDMQGYRVGWGGGFYDRTLDKMQRDGHRHTAIGSAYSGQQMASIVHDELDQPVDWVVTERYAHQVESA